VNSSLCLMIITCALLQQPDANSSEAAIPETVRTTLERNATQLNGLEFELRVERKMRIEAQALPKELQFLSDKAYLEHFLAPEVNLVRIDGKRFFLRSTQGPKGDQIGERTSNGLMLYSGRPPAENTESLLTIDNVDRALADEARTGFPTKHFYWNYFDDAGYHLPEFPKEIGQLPQALVLFLAEQGRVISWLENKATGFHEVVIEAPDPWSQLKLTPQQIKDGVAHLLGESKKIQEEILQRLVARSTSDPMRRYRLTLDPASGFAVREKWEETVRGEALSHAICSDLFQVDGRELWIPRSMQIEIFACEQDPSYVSATPLYSVSATMNRAQAKTFSDQDFDLWYDAPGGSVFDYTAEKAAVDNPVHYRVPADAATLARASQGGWLGLSRTRWLILVNVVIFGAIAFFGIRRRDAVGK